MIIIIIIKTRTSVDVNTLCNMIIVAWSCYVIMLQQFKANVVKLGLELSEQIYGMSPYFVEYLKVSHNLLKDCQMLMIDEENGVHSYF